jgi:predicted Co/Zn/Cd cation transporter (cation efflux family)
MTTVQKTGRVLLFSGTLVIASIVFAMVGAVGLYLVERGRELGDVPEFYHGLVIVLVGIAVNISCVFVLLQIKKADTHLVPPPKGKL